MHKDSRPRHPPALGQFDAYDMHIHTLYSDGVSRPRTILRRARELGIGIAVTDHNEIRGSVACLERPSGVDVVPGIELATNAGVDILAYFAGIDELERFYRDIVESHKGVDPSSFTDLDPGHLIHAVADYAGLSYLAHPFGPMWKYWPRILARMDKKTVSRIHGIEGLNGTMSRKRNDLAVALAERMRKPLVAGSDAHIANRVGECLTLVAEGGGTAYERLRVGQGFCLYRPDLRHWSSGVVEPVRIFGRHARYWPKIFRDKYRTLSGLLR